MSTYTPSTGDVVRYTPRTTWCREGIAIAQDHARLNGRLVLLDTYWGSTEPGMLTDDEADTAELMFNLADYDELDRYSIHASRSQWETYAPADRQIITHQHGLQRRWFIRKGAQPDWATQIDNARRSVAEREDEADRARRAVDWATEELTRLIAAAEAAGYVLP